MTLASLYLQETITNIGSPQMKIVKHINYDWRFIYYWIYKIKKKIEWSELCPTINRGSISLNWSASPFETEYLFV